jgi:hypothetical protein
MPLIKFCFNLIDSVDQAVSLKSLATSKLTKRCHQILNLLLEDEGKLTECEKEEERRKRLKAAQDEKLAKMSPTE